ncbi:MAG TPA: pyrroline-5-carboxylate reductase [Acidimicrobiales bacterium]|nr:pyrroline-5-carboxylate reductase [Acidimicrobiales bacterium]
MTPVRLLIVGGGRMGEALVAGLLRAGWSAEDLAIVELDSGRREALAELFPGIGVHGAPVEADGVVIAVKPQHVDTATREVAEAGCRRVLSIAAGVPTRKLEDRLKAGTPVVRAMPNTPAQVGAGAAAIAPGVAALDADLEWAESILGAVGNVVRVGESDLDAVTGLSGSGPAYVFLLTEALTMAGVAAGLDENVAAALARQTVVGVGRLLESSEESPAALREAVTSPGGTTAAGLEVLRDEKFPEAVVAAVQAATARSKHLGAD